MPKEDYQRLMAAAVVNADQGEPLLSGVPKKIEKVLRGGYMGISYHFTKDEIDFLKNVDAIDLADFAKQTAGYWD
ncbi:MAG: hypothetical protein UR39_C0007G0038 [Candidatus Woesebacteria bacterium GW2011_GWA1_33_30]|uniref:Uncharacterized protein n=1 Tax=Candidatus Woesebacteria bacterium GW2011_GWA2_33_28 TaxID=1618561 RepID=A0A0G0C6N2_9BACT|nr:MAG: hypothetical protein UR38_C0007G0038 [Candidatus Woesebacteria bacterium GW2011_GWA2_33_28]KKP47820.1 MAG: hypothetical protein UR39_C0007G0038 [Candidatus Woesebacteria bacterium GW2011_GWA1_33_30]KKP49265.1 MAG: hypothetical protein UR40_C0008G0038 [Microgenomates group bacterium GW2011_GWC1_33_32]KKP51632.1 MAG: hypothetical protein UR44_C0008G0034 [Candidatus Woesebacteria bacterium GW2011_GWB1_33_38]KKP57635.1 MAG: hypothetical protein UR48_C0013G0010 [Microgenomates group bacteriu